MLPDYFTRRYKMKIKTTVKLIAIALVAGSTLAATQSHAFSASSVEGNSKVKIVRKIDRKCASLTGQDREIFKKLSPSRMSVVYSIYNGPKGTEDKIEACNLLAGDNEHLVITKAERQETERQAEEARILKEREMARAAQEERQAAWDALSSEEKNKHRLERKERMCARATTDADRQYDLYLMSKDYYGESHEATIEQGYLVQQLFTQRRQACK
ncbi:coil containing protein [Vibrio phage 2.275.O._10N.286.54.E11]|nr:coil containing protein [Vibrio phage 2.275.O._10N.286.54.E11]